MTMPDDSPMLAQILIKQGEMSVQLAVIAEKLSDLPDHETRLRALERWRYALPTSLVLGLASAGAAAVSLFRH